MAGRLLVPLAAATLFATPAFAQSGEPAAQPAPAPAFTITGGATIVSDYRFRGISQTDRRFAAQGTFTIAHRSGFYASVWGSSIDDYVANGGDAELDLIAGWRHSWGATTLDAGVLYYYYPGSHGANTDFAEPYVSIAHRFGPVTAKATANYAPSQAGLGIGSGAEDNLYLAGDLSAAIPNMPVSLSAHFGHTFGPSYLSIGDEYSDWNVGASVTLRNITAGVAYVDTDGTFITPSGHDASGAGIVGSLGVAF